MSLFLKEKTEWHIVFLYLLDFSVEKVDRVVIFRQMNVASLLYLDRGASPPQGCATLVLCLYSTEPNRNQTH